MRTMQGDLVFTVRGIMKPGGLASAFGGDLAIMDIYAAQKFFGRGRKFDRIDLALRDDVTLAQGTAKLRALLGPGYEVDPPSSRGEQFEQTSRIYSLASNITSIFALFIGMFIIYNTFAIAVTQRRSEIGILRALGATRSQIRTLFLVESLIAGTFGSALGVLFGIGMAQAMAGYIGGILTDVYGVAQRADGLELNPVLLGGALAMGIVTSLFAAVIPARAAASVDPVKALQKGRNQALGEGESRARRWAALACAAASAIALIFSRNTVIFYAGFVLSGITAVLLAPSLTLWLSRVLRPVLAWVRPVEGTLAADSLIQGPRRTSGTVAALMLSLALVIALGGLARSSYNSLSDWMRIALNPDLFVTTAQNLTARNFVFPASLGDGLRADSRRGRSAISPQRSRHGEGRPCDAGGSGRGFRGTPRETPAGRRRSIRYVPPHGTRRSRAGFRKLRATARRQARRDTGDPRTGRNATATHRRNRARFFRSTRQPADLARRLHSRLA